MGRRKSVVIKWGSRRCSIRNHSSRRNARCLVSVSNDSSLARQQLSTRARFSNRPISAVFVAFLSEKHHDHRSCRSRRAVPLQQVQAISMKRKQTSCRFTFSL
uniref:Uncharacterized protein n=1 Tax=Parascaris equorum TaxID=6256 RepID=A0A914RKW6_PAREQ